MCMKAQCSTCLLASIHLLIVSDKTTWWGCGSHIPSVMDSIPESEWCSCEPQVEREGKKYPPKAAQNA
ncbi:hypothetical protein N7533_003167 [Penicillium manginii]|uniref:uncharacterized protein n=1 Tax=Penicillium manginii TaxID=203109 RepID=UPI002546BA93|nr:uncharacterized protein N7533_003167 [Penicillium manginii]KAJ5764486.1 hypothetical protein N7533_003167 [Penicillium manginii]